MNQDLINYCIAQGDDALILGQRLSEWCYHGPFLEEDLAMSNVALDFIGRAQMFYQYAAELEGETRTADDIAFLRDCREFRNLLLIELPCGDFAFTIARQFALDLYNNHYIEAMLADSNDQRLKEIMAKSIKESRYHLRRSRDWVLRLGDGTEESHKKIQTAFDQIWGYLAELFETEDEVSLIESGAVIDRSTLREAFFEELQTVLSEATLDLPEGEWTVSGGRSGVHTEHLGHILSEMQFLQRAYPGLEW